MTLGESTKLQKKSFEDFIYLLRFSEKITVKLSCITEKDKIIDTLNTEFKKLKKGYIATYFSLNREKKCFVVEANSLPLLVEKTIEKTIKLKVNGYRIPYQGIPELKNLVLEETTQILGFLEILKKIFPSATVQTLLKLLRREKLPSIIAPVKLNNNLIGALGISSPVLQDFFIPSVNNLASHIVMAFERCNLYSNATILARDLEKTNKQLNSYFKYAPGIFYLSDLKGNFIDGNKAAEKTTGYKKQELINKNFLKLGLLPKSEIVKATRLLARNVMGKPTGPDEFTLIRKDGQKVIVELSTRPININDRTVVLATGIDITERRLTERKLISSEDRFRELFNNMSSGVAVYDAVDNGRDFVFKDINKAGEKISGVKRKNIIKKSIKKKFPELDRMGLVDSFRKVFKNGKPIYHPISFYKDNHISLWIDNYIYRLPSGEIVSLYDDITELKKQNENLEDAKERLILFNKISKAFLTIADNNVYNEVLNLVLNFFKSKFGFFGYININKDLVVPSVTTDVWDKCKMPNKTFVFPSSEWGDGLWGRSLKKKRTYHSNKSFNVPKGHIPIKRAISVPIICHNELIGIFMIGGRESDYTSEDVQLLENVVICIAPILYSRLQESIQERERIKAEEQLQFMSLHDRLTGIYNRTYLDEEIIKLQSSREFPISIISLDIDGLKLVNDNLGHYAGDELLKSSSIIIKKGVRKSDVFARVGGDEFTVILPRTDYNTGEKIVTRIKKEIKKYNSESDKLPVSISMGIASAYMKSNSLIDTYKKADKEMYEEKESRRKKVREKLSAYISEAKSTASHLKKIF